MGGEMVFIHKDKQIENLDKYHQILNEMKNVCATSSPTSETAAAADDADAGHANYYDRLNIRRIMNPISDWRNGHVTRYGGTGVGHDDDYELSIDLGWSIRNRDNKYYVLFPKDPNTLKVVSDTHARGLFCYSYNKKWIHDYFLKFVTTFPGVFELYYGDGYSGYDEVGEIDYRDGSNFPVKRTYPFLEEEDCDY